MPFVEVITRKALTQDTKAMLAKELSDTICKIEIGKVTEGARSVDWMWFRVLPEDDWAVGGEFGNKYTHGRTMCYANIIVPDAFMNRELKLQAISEVTQILRQGLRADPGDDGLGIWVIVTEVPRGTWGASGKPSPLPELIKLMEGDVSAERRAEMDAHFSGYDRMKDHFGIPR